MEHSRNGGKRTAVEMDSSPGVANFQQTTSDGSEIHGEVTLAHNETGRGKSRRNRIIFNAAQLNALERLFQDVPYPDMELRTKIADRLDIDESRVTVWFQNRRAKYRRTAKKGTSDPNADFRKGQINSPASTGSHEPSHGEQSPYAGASVQNFVQNIPVSGVEFSTWVNHSHSGGDQSTVIHQSRDMKKTVHNDGDPRIHGLPKDVSNQQRTLEWLRAQNSQQTSPGDVAYDSNRHSQSNDLQQLEEMPIQHRRFDTREPSKEHERKGSSGDDPTFGQNNSSHSFHREYTGYHKNNSGATLRNDEGMPPNKDVQELIGNHLGEALQRLGAGGSHSTRSGAPFIGLQHHSLQYPERRGDLPLHIYPYPSSFHGYPSNGPIYDPYFRPTHTPLSSQQYHFNQDTTSFPSTQTNEWNRITPNSDTRATSQTRDIPVDSYNEITTSNNQLPEGGLKVPPGIRKFPLPSLGQDNRKRRRSFSDDSDENGSVRKTRRKKKYRKRRRKIRRCTKKNELSLSELANPNRHNHTHFDSDKERYVRQHVSRGGTSVKSKLRRQTSSSWDEAGSSSESDKRSSSSSIFSSTSDSDFEIPYCKLTRNQRVPLSQLRPHSSPRNDLTQFGSLVGPVKTTAYAVNLRPSVYHFEDTTSSVTAVSRSGMVASTLHHKDTGERDRLFDGRRNGIGKLSRDEDEINRSAKGQEQDFEPTTFLNLLFGPKSPEIPSGNGSDEDLQTKSLQGQKSKNEEILSESWQIAQNCISPSVVNYSEVNSLSSTHTQPTSTSYHDSREYPVCHRGQGTAYKPDASQRQFTLHYGNNNFISSKKPQNRPRGIIRPLPQKPSATNIQNLTESTSYDAQKSNFPKCSAVLSSPSKRVTGTVRPWVDDTPRATSNPEQDISRPVREPVPMVGPPPNKVCTSIKDSLSPIDLLAKYLTWTGSCYIAQKGH